MHKFQIPANRDPTEELIHRTNATFSQGSTTWIDMGYESGFWPRQEGSWCILSEEFVASFSEPLLAICNRSALFIIILLGFHISNYGLGSDLCLHLLVIVYTELYRPWISSASIKVWLQWQASWMTTSARSVPEATKSGNAKRTVGVMNRFTAIAHLTETSSADKSWRPLRTIRLTWQARTALNWPRSGQNCGKDACHAINPSKENACSV